MDYKGVQRVPSKPETLQIGKVSFQFGIGQTGDLQNLRPGLAAARGLTCPRIASYAASGRAK